MRVGLAMPHYDTSLAAWPAAWDGLSRVARVAEEGGLASLWVSDHLFLDWGKYGGAPEPRGSFECWTTMSALAASTRRIRIGSLTLCNDLRNPGLVAKMIATLDRLSDGRVDPGFGGGWYEPEYRSAGIPFEPAGARINKVGEAVGVVRRLLRGEEVTFEGHHYSFDGAICRPVGVQSPNAPLWIGGKGDLLIRTVVAVADGWNFSWLGPVDLYQERLRHFEAECERALRDPTTIRRSVGVYLLAGTDAADVRRRFERLVERSPTGVLSGAASGTGVSWDEFRAKSFVGTTDEVIGRLGRLRDLGVDEVIVTLGAVPFQVADEEEVAFLASEIAPALA